MTTKTQIASWFDRGREQNAIYMFVFCDSFSYEDYPSYAYSIAEAKEIMKKNGQNMQKLMEIYDLYNLDKESQLNKHRAWVTL